jgi:osmotically-inducible protein OsmY
MKQLNAIKYSMMIGLAAGSLCLIGCASDDRTHETSGEALNDASISSHVVAALADSSDYKYSDVQANTFKGTVQLSGFVDTGTHKDQAGMVAKNVEGVKDVINNISVK